MSEFMYPRDASKEMCRNNKLQQLQAVLQQGCIKYQNSIDYVSRPAVPTLRNCCACQEKMHSTIDFPTENLSCFGRQCPILCENIHSHDTI